MTEALTCCQVFVDVTVKKCGMPSSGSTVHIVINRFDSYVINPGTGDYLVQMCTLNAIDIQYRTGRRLLYKCYEYMYMYLYYVYMQYRAVR